ncbi:hypothetical protein ELI55_17785 [Rhizobium ruizarguesonis]|uniref:phage tail terminator protein n=1 Tax=Rhizobium ruizarguesonis TaxID=2081791 RepID=UPI00103192DE|nr:hypothetical protein [Rhizobium ruizarguesonis]TAU06569.1 hypothetical protein ELI55_17785 [Rhizobium ruizarguesonis]TAZ41445.1 hypothetical protein ELH74_19500 [Rhizobium ruizarguesonis]
MAVIDEVADRLKTHATALSDVRTAEDLDALSKGTAPKSGTAFVLPYRERAEPNELGMGSFRQLVAVQVLVAIVIRKHDDAQGGKRVSGFDALRDSVETALAGWAIASEDQLFELVSAQAAALGNGVTVYVQTWQTSRYLEK